VFGLPPSPSLEFVHASATLSRRFVSWLRRAAKNYGDLLELKAVVDNRLREERLKELAGAEKTKLTEVIMTYEKILADLGRIAKSDVMDTFRITGEGLIKWVGDETISLGYTGMRERSAQYWLWDAKTGWRAEEISLPPEKKMRDVLGFYRVETYDVFHVPSQEEAERELLDFLENVKKWPRNRLGWIVGYVYPLNDETGGFWTLVRKVVELVSLRDVWEDLLETRAVEDELMKMPQFEDLKTILASELDAQRHVREIAEEAKKELVDKYGERTEDIDRVKGEFSARAKAILSERVAPETKIGEVYEQVKSLVPADKVELTRVGLWKAIRWAFLHPEISVDAFASGQVFPLGFTTEQARAIASKILEKVVKKPVAPPVRLTSEETGRLAEFFIGMLRTAGVPLPTQYKSEFEKAMDITKTYEENLPLVRKVAEGIIKRIVAPPAKIEFVKVRFLKDMPAIVGADMKVYGPFAKGDVVELPKVNAEVIVKQEIASYTLVPPALPTEKIEALRTVAKVKADDLGLEWTAEVWSRFWKEYEARARELWATRGVTYLEEEVENVLKAVAAPITPPAVRRERVRRPPLEVPVEAPAEVFVSPVTIPRVSISKLPFPRAPSTEEQAILWDAFRYEMARLGQDPFRWRDNFMMHVLNRPYPDWATVLKNFNDFIEAIRTGKPFRLLPLVTLPMPWREEEEQRKYDAILHFIATKLYPSMDELLHGLYTYGVEVTEDDVKKAVKKGYAEKNVWFTSVPKEFLEALTGEKL